MPQETINLLLGAFIGIVASLLTTLLNQRFQRDRENQKRIWEVEDRKHKEKREILQERIKQTEIFATNVLKIFKDVREICRDYLVSDTEKRKKLIKEFLNKIDNKYETITGYEFMPYVINNEVLIQKIDEFQKIILGENSFLEKIFIDINDQKITSDELTERFTEAGDLLEKSYAEIISKLDEILANQE